MKSHEERWNPELAERVLDEHMQDYLRTGIYQAYTEQCQRYVGRMASLLEGLVPADQMPTTHVHPAIQAELPIMPVIDPESPLPGIDLYRVQPSTGQLLKGSNIGVSYQHPHDPGVWHLSTGFTESQRQLLAHHERQLHRWRIVPWMGLET